MTPLDDLILPFTAFFLLGYIDAGTGSLIIQMVIGFAAGGLLALKLFWSRIRGKFKKKQAETNKAESEQTDLHDK